MRKPVRGETGSNNDLPRGVDAPLIALAGRPVEVGAGAQRR
jgi:hypothetical protein